MAQEPARMSRARAPAPGTPRSAARAVRAFAAGALALGLAGCSALPPVEMLVPPGQDKMVDEQTRKNHFTESAQTFYEGGRYNQAAEQWIKVLEIEPGSQKAKWGLAKSYAMIGTPTSLREAEKLYIEIFPQSFVHPTRGDIKFEVERDLAQVYVDLAEWLDRAMSQNKERLEKSKTPDPALQAAVVDQRTRRDEYLRKAIPLYDSVLAKSPENPYALGGLAKAYLVLGDDRTGIEYAKRYIALSHKNQEQWTAQLRALEKRMGKATDLERDFFLGRVRGAKDKEVGMRLLVGSTMIRDGRYDEAVEQYTWVLRLEPSKAAAYAERGQAFAMSGKYRRAVRDLEEYMKITDPVKHNEARVSAFELLEKYRVIAAGEPKIDTEDIAPYKVPPDPVYAPVEVIDDTPPPPPEPAEPKKRRRGGAPAPTGACGGGKCS
jgi:tetratricopeptide (TPR) repeat protein